MQGWVDQVVAATIEAESPERYQYWGAMCALAAVLRKNVFVDRYHYILYPNIYVMIVGKSGIRKGNPVTLSKRLVAEVNNTRIVAGRASIQAIVKELGKPLSVANDEVLREAHAFLVAGEAASFMVKDPDALNIMTDLYDTHAHEPEWRNMLKHAGTDILKNPCLTFLWATNEDHFDEAVAQKDVKGGFIARSLIVLEEKRRTINDLMDPPQCVPNIKELGRYLKEVSKLKGAFKIEKDAKLLYRTWYKQLSTIPHEDSTGTIERLGDTVLKVAMLVSVSNELTMRITEEIMEEAISVSVECLGGLKLVTMGSGKSEFARPTKLILDLLVRKEDHRVSRKYLLSKFWGEFDSIVLDRVMETLVQSDTVDIHKTSNGAEYEMRKDKVALYQKFRREIN